MKKAIPVSGIAASFMKTIVPNFKDKVLYLVLTGRDSSRAIANPRFELQCGRLFLVGTSPPDASDKNWVTGLQYAVAWDSIMDYIVFDSLAEYRRRLSTCYRKKKPMSEP